MKTMKTVIRAVCLFPCVVLCAGGVVAQATADPVIGATPAGGPIIASPPGGSSNAVDFLAGSGLCGANSNQSIGWQFDVLAPVTVSAMSWFDDGQDGLTLPHEVGIWNPAGTLIAATNVVIPAGTAATLDGIWRVVPITPAVLTPGNGYIVGGFNGAGSFECLSSNVVQTVHPSLDYIDATFSDFGAVLERPTSFSGALNGFYGVGFQIGAAECFLVVGDGPGTATHLEDQHLFTTLLDQVHQSVPVLMESVAEFVLPPSGSGGWTVGAGGFAGGSKPGGVAGGPPGVPEWLWDGRFSVQILMWNPTVFPALPEQSSHGLHVVVRPDGSVVTRPFGGGTGIDVWVETGVNAQGQPVVRFPFLIPGI